MEQKLSGKWDDVKKRIQDQSQYKQTSKVSVMCKADR